MIANVWLIPAFPLAAFLINGLFGRRWLGHCTGRIATAAVGALGARVDRRLPRGARWRRTHDGVTLYEWIGRRRLPRERRRASSIRSRRHDALVVTVVVVPHLRLLERLHGPRPRLLALLHAGCRLFVFAMLILVMADNYLLMFVGWEGVGLCSYLLIGFWFERPSRWSRRRRPS